MPEQSVALTKLRVVSGGLSGADIAALDWAISHGVDHGGWCPKGRRSEDGPIEPRYQLSETPLVSYTRRRTPFSDLGAAIFSERYYPE